MIGPRANTAVGHIIGSVIVLDVVLPFQNRQLFLTSGELSLRGGRVLLRRHVIEYDDVPFLHVKAIEVI